MTTRCFSASTSTPPAKAATFDRAGTLSPRAPFSAAAAGNLPNEEEILRQMTYFADRHKTNITMKVMLETAYGNLLPATSPHIDGWDNLTIKERMYLQVASFLRRELPVRFAHRARELDNMPEGLYQMKSIQKVKSWYVESFRDLLAAPPLTSLDNEKIFNAILDGIYRRHADTNVAIAQGLTEFKTEVLSKKTFKRDLSEIKSIHKALDEFFSFRIGIRVLIGQFQELHKEQREGMIGLIDTKMVPKTVCSHAVEDAQYMCQKRYGFSPEVEFLGSNLGRTLSYIPSHLYYVMFELVKNSLRATVEFHQLDEDKCPPVRIIISDGEDNEDVVIKVSDEGGGIKRSHMPRVFSYLFTTATSPLITGNVELHDFDRNSPLAGLGYGLPVARSYARYFGGDLTIVPIEGFGTDAYVHLSRITDNKEPLL